ncbi:hypothetical protein [Ideonella sp.]|uniref:hypothetical protein n=1 Tax=Ideonella sp. TaxID=1929293 RepID=UPI0039C87C7E
MTTDPNIAGVELVAKALGPLMDELVLVGGCAVGLLITDQTRPPVRATADVDLLTEVTPRTSYYAFCDQLKARGFRECDEVICRWLLGNLKVDVMPTDEGVLTFTNSWYAEAAKTAQHHTLPNGTPIRVIAAPLFIATKLESFRSRGNGDYLHHDMEDIVIVLDGRPAIAHEVRANTNQVQEYLRDEFEALLLDEAFDERLIWLLGGVDARKPIVLSRIREITGL